MPIEPIHHERAARVAQVLRDVYASGAVEDSSGGPLEVGRNSITARSGEKLRRLVSEVGARRCIETGFAHGLSGLHLVQAMYENGCDEPTHVAMDPFQDKRWGDSGLVLFERAGVRERLQFEYRHSEYVLPQLIESAAEPFDLAFVDGGHLFEMAFMDIGYLLRLVRPGGLVVVDDVWMPSVRWAIDYWCKNLGVTQRTEERKARLLGRRRPPRFRVLEVPERFRERDWRDFVPFGGPRLR